MYHLEQWSAKGQYFDFQGHRIFYVAELDAAKPVLVLLHGFPTSSWDWHRVWGGLRERFSLLAADFIGYGSSAKPLPHHYNVPEQADIVEALLAQSGVNQYHILAHDFGDTVAQELIARDNARDDDRRIASVVLTNGGLFPETHRPVLMQRLLMSPVGPWVARLASFRKFRRNFDHICARKLDEQELKSLWRLINQNGGRVVMSKLIYYMEERRQNRDRWVTALQAYQGPMALVNGVEDPISGEHMVQRYQELISSECIYRLKGVGHYPQLEASAEFLEACHTFWQTRLPVLPNEAPN